MSFFANSGQFVIEGVLDDPSKVVDVRSASLESRRFSDVFRCDSIREDTLSNGRHGLFVTCDPPVVLQGMAVPEEASELLLVNRFDGDDIWDIVKFPFFVHIALPPAGYDPTTPLPVESLTTLACVG